MEASGSTESECSWEGIRIIFLWQETDTGQDSGSSRITRSLAELNNESQSLHLQDSHLPQKCCLPGDRAGQGADSLLFTLLDLQLLVDRALEDVKRSDVSVLPSWGSIHGLDGIQGNFSSTWLQSELAPGAELCSHHGCCLIGGLYLKNQLLFLILFTLYLVIWL